MKLTPMDWRRQVEPIPEPSRVNLGPLTTVFAAPDHCSRAALAGTAAVRGQSCQLNGATLSAADDTGCWPRATAYPSMGPSSLAGMGFYSPGVMCPTGYYSACTAVSTSKGQTAAAPQVTGKFQFPLVAGETAVGCCPTGYSCAANGGAQTCHQVATQTNFDAMTCEGLAGNWLEAQVPMTLPAGETVATMDLWAPMIQINHMATDLPVTETPTTRAPSSSATKKSVTASASPTDDVRVKDVNEDELVSEETSTKAAARTSKDAPADAATPTPTISVTPSDPVIVGAPAGPAAPDDLLLDTRLPPSMTGGMFATPTFDTAAADSTALPSAGPTQSSYSTAMKVGIACSPVAGAALVFLGIFAFKRRKHKSNKPEDMHAKSISSAGSSTHQATYFGGSHADTASVSRAHNIGGFATPVHDSPYNEDRASEMAMHGPGPTVIAPSGYSSENKMTPADFYANPWSEKDDYETRPYEPAPPHFKHGHAFSDDIGSVESPIDSVSPFRLKRGDTLRGREKRLTGADNERHVSIEAEIVTSNPDRDSASHSRSSHDSVEWDEKETLQRSVSFSKIRPRPRTAASSVYLDDRDTIMSWDLDLAPEMPDKPLPSIPEKGGLVELNRSKSFSRPRPKRDQSEETLVKDRAVGTTVAPPPVTAEGVRF